MDIKTLVFPVIATIGALLVYFGLGAKLMEHYPADTTVAICYRLGWEDEKIFTVPLSETASVTQQENLPRTTLFVISPALNKVKKV